MMRIFWSYLSMEGKRGFCLLYRMIALICLLLILLAAGFAVIYAGLQKGLLLEKTQVALVIPEEEEMTRLLSGYAADMDSVKSICEFQYYEKEGPALKALETDQVQACIVFPENFYEDVDTGVNTPAKVYVREGSKQSTGLFIRLLKDGVRFLQISEAGIYAALDTAEHFDAKEEGAQIAEELLEVYAYGVLERTDGFREERNSPIGALSPQKYLYTAILLFGMLLPGLFFGALYKRQMRAVEEKLLIMGINAWIVSLVRFLIMGMILWLFGALIYFAGVGLTVYGDWNLVHMELQVLLLLLPFSLFLAGIYHGVYGLLGEKTGVLFLLWLDMCILLCAGVVIPLPFLPQPIRTFAEWAHLSFVHDTVCRILYGQLSFPGVLGMVIVPVLGFLAGGAGLWKRS